MYPLVGEVGGHQQPLPVELHSLGLAQLGRERGVPGPRPAAVAQSCTELHRVALSCTDLRKELYWKATTGLG